MSESNIVKTVGKFEIAAGIPIPDANNGQQMYPFDDLEVGQSFFVPRKTTSQMGPSIARARQRLSRTFVVRTVEERFPADQEDAPQIRGVRIWRQT